MTKRSSPEGSGQGRRVHSRITPSEAKPDNGPVVITWIGRGHELYSGASLTSLVEHCVTFRHDRRLLSLLGFVHNWPTSRWSVPKKPGFSLNGNGIMSSFLGRQFYCATLYIKIKFCLVIIIMSRF